MRKVYIEEYEAIELLEKMSGRDLQSDSEMDDYEKAEDLCLDEFDCDLETFKNIVGALLPMTPVMKSEMSDDYFHCFVERFDGFCGAIVKCDYKSK